MRGLPNQCKKRFPRIRDARVIKKKYTETAASGRKGVLERRLKKVSRVKRRAKVAFGRKAIDLRSESEGNLGKEERSYLPGTK